MLLQQQTLRQLSSTSWGINSTPKLFVHKWLLSAQWYRSQWDLWIITSNWVIISGERCCHQLDSIIHERIISELPTKQSSWIRRFISMFFWRYSHSRHGVKPGNQGLTQQLCFSTWIKADMLTAAITPKRKSSTWRRWPSSSTQGCWALKKEFMETFGSDV